MDRRLHDLLDLQEIDSEIDRLLERRQAMPELAAYQKVHADLQRMAASYAELEAELKRTDLFLDKAEGELKLLEAKRNAEERRMYSGLSSKELGFLRKEVEMLGRQVGGREEEILASLEEKDRLVAGLAAARAETAAASAEERRLSLRIAGEWKRIDTEIAVQEGKRRDVMPRIESAMLGLYEKLRPHKQGVAIARLAEGTCGGCHLRLSNAEQAEAKKDTPPRCLHCRRILVLQ